MPIQSSTIATRDRRYSAIARACLAVLNHQSFHKKSQKEQIEAVYQAIDKAFSEQQQILLRDIDEMNQAMALIQEAAQNGDLASCEAISGNYVAK